ncbi:MAG: hypothetical protein ACI382_04845 [Alloprevotella sp.]
MAKNHQISHVFCPFFFVVSEVKILLLRAELLFAPPLLFCCFSQFPWCFSGFQWCPRVSDIAFRQQVAISGGKMMTFGGQSEHFEGRK